MLNESESYTFKPKVSKAHRTNIWAAVAIAIMVPLSLWLFKDEDSPIVLAVFGIGGALVFLAYESWLISKGGLQSVTMEQDILTISDKAGSQTIRWLDIKTAKHKLRGGEKWIFKLKHERNPFTFFLEGYSFDDEEAINKLLTEQLKGHEIPIEGTKASDFSSEIINIIGWVAKLIFRR